MRANRACMVVRLELHDVAAGGVPPCKEVQIQTSNKVNGDAMQTCRPACHPYSQTCNTHTGTCEAPMLHKTRATLT